MTKAETLLLVLIASVPIQLGKFFFLPHSYVLGIPIDYRAVTFYFSDFVIISYLLVFFWENHKNLKKISFTQKNYFLAISIFNLYLLISTALFSTSYEASYFFNLKLFIFSILPIVVSYDLKNKNVSKITLNVLKISILWQSALIMLQFLHQGSVGIWLLGERTLDTTTAQIAHSSFFGTQFLRPYGTFSHPNVAAAYLVLSQIVLVPTLRGVVGTILIPTLALLLTFSKSAIFILTVGVILTAQNARRLLVYIIPALLMGTILFIQLLSSQIASVSERLLLIQIALDISTQNPLFGIGSNNFTLELSKLDLTSLSQTRLLQPVHNVFLLILAENGAVGLLLFSLVLLSVAKSVQGKIKALLFGALLFYLSVDHFLWTLQQGQLIFWLAIAYILTTKQTQKSI